MATIDPAFQFTRIHTEDVVSRLVGGVLDPQDHRLMYDEISGPQNSTAAMWAILMSAGNRKKGMPLIEGFVGQFEFIQHRQTVHAPISGTTYQDWATKCEDKRLVFASDLRHLMLLDAAEQAALDAETTRQMEVRLLASINSNVTNTVADPAWGPAIYQYIQANYFPSEVNTSPYRELTCVGSVTKAWWLNREFDWQGLIQTMLRAGLIAFAT